jgi:hypothetical protein
MYDKDGKDEGTGDWVDGKKISKWRDLLKILYSNKKKI